jgi:hypothetical protein
MLDQNSMNAAFTRHAEARRRAVERGRRHDDVRQDDLTTTNRITNEARPSTS